MTQSKESRPADTSSSSTPTLSNPAESAGLCYEGLAADEQTRLRAYQLYRDRGGRVGDDMGDWLQAEREYLEFSSKVQSAGRDGRRTLDPTPSAIRF
ncbi:MAG: DUF2934 domain-containing protein [Gemmatimonadaceae bacterium]